VTLKTGIPTNIVATHDATDTAWYELIPGGTNTYNDWVNWTPNLGNKCNNIDCHINWDVSLDLSMVTFATYDNPLETTYAKWDGDVKYLKSRPFNSHFKLWCGN